MNLELKCHLPKSFLDSSAFLQETYLLDALKETLIPAKIDIWVNVNKTPRNSSDEDTWFLPGFLAPP